MHRTSVNPGIVEWSGENPGIYLKSDLGKDYSAVAVFFRVVLSPHGRGVGAIVLGEPASMVAYPDAPNMCLTDNRPLMKYLVANFVSKFPTFMGQRGLEGMSWHDVIDSNQDNRNMPHSYSEELVSDTVRLQLTWKGIKAPMAVEVGPDASATKLHDMYAVFAEAKDAAITINGSNLPGQVATRQFFGQTMSTAFLALSETWVTPI